MANRYWVGGTAAWDATAGTKWALTSGGPGGQGVPTAADDVFFDGASGAVTCTITGSRVAQSINCTGFTGTLAGASSPALTISRSLTLVAGMTLTYAGTTTFNATATITSGGKTLGGVTVNGSGITVTLGDALNLGTNTLTVTTGTFNTSNFNVTCGSISSSNTNTRTITLGSSTVTLSGGTPISLATTTNLTFNANTSQINCSANSTTFDGGGLTFYNVSHTSTAIATLNFNGANTFNNLTFAARAASGTGSLNFGANQTINGAFTVQSGATDPTRRLLIASNTIGTARTITSASNTIFGADFRDIAAAGVASWSDSTRTNYWGDCKGNTGITFATGRTVYWNLGGTVFWYATAWALTSNGTPAAANFPLAQDTAAFTNDGAASLINVNGNYHVNTVDMSARTSSFNLSLNNSITVYGNWTNSTAVNLPGNANIIFSGRNTQTFTTNDRTFAGGMEVNSPGGTVNIVNNLLLTNGSFSFISLTNGTLNIGNNNVTASGFLSSNSNVRTLSMGSGLWTLIRSGLIVWDLGTTTNLTFDKGTANIFLDSVTPNNRNFAGGGLTYNKLTIGTTTSTGSVTITGANTFGELASTRTAANSIIFSADQTITKWTVTGSSGNPVTIGSNAPGTARTLTITNRTIDINFLYVSDINAPLTPVTFFVGNGSRLISNVQGVACASAPANAQSIYVLNTGTSWTVPANWNNSNNEIHLFGGGGGGSGSNVAIANSSTGAGGGGGGYTKVTNLSLTPGGSVSYAIGAAGTAAPVAGSGGNGGTTTFNSGTYTAGGGAGATTIDVPPRQNTPGTGGTGSTYNGGNGGNGSEFGSTVSFGAGGGGGGGCGGPLGNGGVGGDSYLDANSNNISGGGGGGNGGGGNGGNGTSAVGGTGGNNNAGAGGGTSGVGGFNGGGGGGSVGVFTTGTIGGNGIDIPKAGLGGGGGAGGAGQRAGANGGLYGGGGSGGGATPSGANFGGGAGGQGAIIIWYDDGTTPPSNGNFFFLFA